MGATPGEAGALRSWVRKRVEPRTRAVQLHSGVRAMQDDKVSAQLPASTAAEKSLEELAFHYGTVRQRLRSQGPRVLSCCLRCIG